MFILHYFKKNCFIFLKLLYKLYNVFYSYCYEIYYNKKPLFNIYKERRKKFEIKTIFYYIILYQKKFFDALFLFVHLLNQEVYKLFEYHHFHNEESNAYGNGLLFDLQHYHYFA